MSQIRPTDGITPKPAKAAEKKAVEQQVETAQANVAKSAPSADRVMSPQTAQIYANMASAQITTKPKSHCPAREEGLPASASKACAHKKRVDMDAILANLDPALLNPETLKGLQTLSFS